MNWVMLQKYSLHVSKRLEYLTYEEIERAGSVQSGTEMKWGGENL